MPSFTYGSYLTESQEIKDRRRRNSDGYREVKMRGRLKEPRGNMLREDQRRDSLWDGGSSKKWRSWRKVQRAETPGDDSCMAPTRHTGNGGKRRLGDVSKVHHHHHYHLAFIYYRWWGWTVLIAKVWRHRRRCNGQEQLEETRTRRQPLGNGDTRRRLSEKKEDQRGDRGVDWSQLQEMRSTEEDSQHRNSWRTLIHGANPTLEKQQQKNNRNTFVLEDWECRPWID